MGIDNVSLRYYGAGDVINDAKNASHKLAWEEAKAAAEAAIANHDYDNVTGKEKGDLENEIAKAEPSTSDGYDTAAAALNTATAAFTAAKANYDIFATYNTTLAYADTDKKPAITSESTAASIITALRAYYESNALAEGIEGATNITNRIANANNPASNEGWTWTGNKNDPRNNEPWTDADGTNTHSYFDGGNWGATSWTTTMGQTISLPAGKYLLTAKARAATNVTFTMSVGEASVELPHVGSTGNVFDRGWGDASLEFTTDQIGNVTISVSASSSTLHEWFSIADFRLVRLELTTEMADADDYTALDDAVAAAKAKTLGFESGEYAPYNNVEAIKAISTAEAIDQNEENAKDEIVALTNTLTTWTVNAAQVNAIYDGDFAIQEEHTTGPTALAGWNNPQGIRQLIKNTETYPGLNSASAKAAVFAWGNTTMTYGNTEGYTMPLAAHTIYELSFKTCGWSDGDMGYVNVDIKNSNNEGLQTVQTATATKRINEEEPWDEFKILFVTGEAGNYTFGMWTSKHTTFTDLKLVKAASQVLEFADNAEMPKYAPGTYPAVKINRTLTAGHWATAVYPFAVSGVDNIATLTGYADSKLSFTSADASEANVPFLMRSTDGVSEINLENVEVAAAAATEAVAGQAKLIGAYAATEISDVAAENKNNYVLSNNTIYRVGENSATINPYRAYIQVADAAQANALTFIVDDEVVTGIEGIATSNEQVGTLYNLNGQRVQSAKKGLYIQNGKKVVLK
jgi:hypothetical protein